MRHSGLNGGGRLLSGTLKGTLKMKFNMLKSIIAGSALVAISLGASSAQAATNSVTATANAKILAAVTITNSTALNFGTAVSGAAAGSVTVAATVAGAQTCTTVTCVGGGATSAQFAVQGTSGGNVAITLPANVTLTGPGANMVATLTSSAPVTGLVLTGVAATDVFQVGGTLPVAINQVGGTYTGTFAVSVAYQ